MTAYAEIIFIFTHRWEVDFSTRYRAIKLNSTIGVTFLSGRGTKAFFYINDE